MDDLKAARCEGRTLFFSHRAGCSEQLFRWQKACFCDFFAQQARFDASFWAFFAFASWRQPKFPLHFARRKAHFNNP
jgi:hypothetical protein